jgi:sugar lactone lactonase YvrE
MTMTATSDPVRREKTLSDHDDESDGDYLGRDADGHRHYWHMGRQRVTVRDATGQLVHRARSPERPLSHWIAFVECEVGGWAELPGYSDADLAEMIEVRDDG